MSKRSKRETKVPAAPEVPERITEDDAESAEDLANEALGDTQEEAPAQEPSEEGDNPAKEEAKDEVPVSEPVEAPTQEPAPSSTIQTEQTARTAIARIKAQLRSEETVRMIIPLSPGEEAGKAVLEGGIGGHMWAIKKGEMVELPHSIFLQVSESLSMTQKALSRTRANRTEFKEGTTVLEALS